MIRVTIELIPLGIGKAKHLGTIDIANDASGTMTTGNYRYSASNKAGGKYKSGNVKGFPRKRLLAYDLLYRCLKDMIGDRND